MDFQLIPTTSLGFQVALKFGETAPLKFVGRYIALVSAIFYKSELTNNASPRLLAAF